MKIYTNKVKESWIIDRISDEWHKFNPDMSTENIKDADIIWVVANWVWKNIPKRHLKKKKVICSVYHIDFDNFDSKQKEDFKKLDGYVDLYHVISLKTKKQLERLTSKKIISIPFWVNQNNWYHIDEKRLLRKELGFNDKEYLIGSFQRDTEGSDLKSPKLIKGPDIFINIVKELNKKTENLKIILTGTRRQYVMSKLDDLGMPYTYFEMADIPLINKLYNVLDLYLVTSRLEGGPQAILECAVSKTPILSTDVGVASEILHKDSIYSAENFNEAKINVDYAYEIGKKFIIPDGMKVYREMFRSLHEG
jgi:glycosyltransferase involved in cell wall biosynthesis